MKRFSNLFLSFVLLIGLFLSYASINARASATTSVVVNPFLAARWTSIGAQEGAMFGASVAPAGDLNGDGFVDIIVGSPHYTHGQNWEGKADVFYGSAAGISETPGWSFESDLAYCELGWNVASAGDVDSDGFDDVLVSSEYCSPTPELTTREGRVYLFKGSAGGLSTTYSWMAQGAIPSDESFGWSIASAGDVNDDGFEDVIIGASWASYPEAHEGRAYVYYGEATPTGLPATASWITESNLVWNGFGEWVDSAGDVNGDGFDDVIIGWPNYTDGELEEGTARVYLGSSSGLGAALPWNFQNNTQYSHLGSTLAGVGDVNADGFDDVIVGGRDFANPDLYEGVAYLFFGSASGPSSTPDWSAEGNQVGAQFGWAVNPAGDVNADGFDDVVIGAQSYNSDEINEGKVFLYFGSLTGLRSNPVYAVEGNQENAQLGWSVNTAGDVNKDGVDDIIVGAPTFAQNNMGFGKADIYYGRTDAAAYILLPLVIR